MYRAGILKHHILVESDRSCTSSMIRSFLFHLEIDLAGIDCKLSDLWQFRIDHMHIQHMIDCCQSGFEIDLHCIKCKHFVLDISENALSRIQHMILSFLLVPYIAQMGMICIYSFQI
jgi:hypothetical protein